MTQHAISWRERTQPWFTKTRPSHASRNQSSMLAASDSNRVLLCFLTGSLFTYLCAHLLRKIVFQFALRDRNMKIYGRTSLVFVASVATVNTAGCSDWLQICNRVWGLDLILFSCWFLFRLSLLAHNCRYFECRMVGDGCSLVSPFFRAFSWWCFSND